ncbi:5'/3'-nucleotidase SurE [Limibacillus halophilus]
MLEALPDLSQARILVTNDDGVNAPGIEVLAGIARSLSDDVWIVAPEVEQSATSHSLTMRRPLRVRELGERRYSIDGTPTDCVLVATRTILQKQKQPDLILSGINMGGNLGEDVTYSGTVAAAMEGALLGYRSIALSQVREGDHGYRWQTPEAWGAEVIRKLASVEQPRETLINVNFPDVEPEAVRGLKVCRQGKRDEQTAVVEGVDPGGRPYVWIGSYQSDKTSVADSDLEAVAQGWITITPLHLDLTYDPLIKRIKDATG